MTRPTAAQFAYGSCTVIFSTLAMLLLSRTTSGPGVVLVALAALGLGLLVALTVAAPRTRPTVTAVPSRAPAAEREPVSATRGRAA